MDNRILLEKADLDTGQLVLGGELTPATAQRFIRILIDESVVMPMATVVPMRAPQQRLDKARFSTRALRAGTEAQALPVNDRTRPDLSREELNAQLFRAEVRITDEALEDSIEGGNFRDTIISLLGERIALDMDDMIVNGDTASADPFYAKFDGILKQAAVNVVSNGSNPISKTILRDMLKAMPTEFLRNKRRLRYLTSVDAEIDYRDATNARETTLGDVYLEEDRPVAYSGVPLLDVPVFPENLGVGTNETQILLTDPKNINVGIWRKMRVETDKDISAGVLVVVVSLRFDTKFTERSATVRADNVTVA